MLTAGEGESILAGFLKEFEETLPINMKLAYLPAIARVRLRLTASGPDEIAMQKMLDEKFEEMRRLLPSELIASLEDEPFEAVIGRLLKERNHTLSTAESCTGGYLAHLITTVPGSSAYFIGSVISYSNEVKVKQLGVSAETIREHGAVSEKTVREMAAGALELFKTDLAVATSGIAGPEGGTPEKPVGTIWLAVGNKNGLQTQKLQLGKDRLRNIQYTAFHALNMVRLFLREV
jgi:nicotinamide-nucleotide amidase